MAQTEQRPDDWKHQPQSLSGKRILVTGGTTGIGRAAARALAAMGAKVFIFGRDEQHLQDALAELGQEGEVKGVSADSSSLDDVRRVFGAVDQQLGGIDILVNCAALPGRGIAEMELEEVHAMVGTNIFGYLACAREALHRMQQNPGDGGIKGHILCVGSMSAEVGDPGADVYTATKGAIRSFCYSLRQSDANQQGIKVSLIEPGQVGTDMQPSTAEEQRQQIEKMETLAAEDIAESIVYCLTQPARSDVVWVQIRPHGQAI